MQRILLSLVLLAAGIAVSGERIPDFTNPELGMEDLWNDARWVPDPADPAGERGRWTGWFSQDAVDSRKLAEGFIRARVEGEWQEYPLVTLPEDYLDWNFTSRLQQLGEYREMLTGGARRSPTLSGPHSGMVATHGAQRRDTHFTINNAVKGVGWLPKAEKLAEVAELFRRTWDDSLTRKLAVLESLYRQGAELFDLTKQTSLELYARPGFETHTFLNQMSDPGVTIVFLDMPKSYELRCIAQMLHPENPNLTDYEKQVVEYINMVHDYFHGKAPRPAIGVIYHVVQVFDNSPPRGAGRRVVPPYAEE
ncbi:MAG TPA: hypothetical protein ENN51_01210 [candidate division WOR-3 bacterium]|uniref:Uncharacterized protein n=1 Tax=candidate division WOR-3 bacterium TaxID=2052148 RepID=A0A7V0T497_UNCW3|nr:hypothetical protein [candidate division WOR-3 bacterium]